MKTLILIALVTILGSGCKKEVIQPVSVDQVNTPSRKDYPGQLHRDTSTSISVVVVPLIKP